jgi:protein TonB
VNFRIIFIGFFLIIISFAVAAQADPHADTTKVPVYADNSEYKIFEKVDIEATFPGGDQAWRTYLERNVNAQVPADNGAPGGTYTVIVQFVVDKEGNISNVQALTKHGYGMEKEVVRIITKGPKWIPAMQDGKAVKAYRKQPVTFMVITERRSKKKKNTNIEN